VGDFLLGIIQACAWPFVTLMAVRSILAYRLEKARRREVRGERPQQ
jgi:hypothetical protein